jgi:hypothetical protein
MGILDRNQPLVISHKFDYLPLRDPRLQPAELFEVMPDMGARNKSGEEFLKKYLAIVRTRLPRNLVQDWFEGLAGNLDEFIHLSDKDSNADDFLGFMVQGFAMSACEDSYFEIAKLGRMSECAWEAMRSMTISQSMTNEEFRGQSCLNALLSGYYLAKEFAGSKR